MKTQTPQIQVQENSLRSFLMIKWIGSISLLLIFSISLNAQTVTWTGMVNDDWNFLLNWSPMQVPTANDHVEIPDVTNDPTIKAGTNALAKSVEVMSDAELTIVATGSLEIKNSSNNAIVNSVEVKANAKLTIENTASLTFNSANQHIILNQGMVENFGEISIPLSLFSDALVNEGAFINKSSGNIQFGKIEATALDNKINGTFTNEGTISMGASGQSVRSGITNDGTFFNEGNGYITIDIITNDGIFNNGTFINKAKLSVGFEQVGGAIFNFGIFDNEGNGEIQIGKTGQFSSAISNYSDGIFTNKAKIEIGLNKKTGKDGIENQGGIFNNESGGDIHIYETGRDGISNSSGGMFTNNGNIFIGENKKPDKDGMNNSSSLINGICGVIHCYDNLKNTSTLTNDGFVELNTTDTHANSGTFTNKSIINTIGSTLGGVTNNEIFVEKTVADNCPITLSPALNLGNPVDFTIDGIFTDMAAIISAGTYVQATNTFTPNSAFSNTGSNTYYVKITDGTNGCTRIAEWVVNQTDNIAPEAKCKASVSIDLNSSGFASISVSDIDDGSTDGCGIDDYSFDRSTDFNCTDFANSPVDIKMIVTDEAGNQDDCTTSVTINDPLMACCANPDVPFLTASHTNPCPGGTVILYAFGQLNDATKWVLYSGSCGGTKVDENTTGSFHVTVNATTNYFIRGEGGCVVGGNCGTLTITPQDNQNPVAICPTTTPVVTLDASGNGTLAANALAGGNSTDNCSVTETSPATSFGCAEVGSQTVTLTATDGNGNTNTADCAVTVQDNINPVAVCPTTNPVLTLDANGNAVLAANALAGNSTDNCSVTETSPMMSYTCSQLGNHTVTLTATDPSGNTHSANCTITVEDTAPPTVTCKDITIELGNAGTLTIAATDVYQSTSDNCGIATMTVSPNTFDCSNKGVNVVVLTVNDYAGNSDDCNANVTVEDTTNPVANCKPATIQLNANGLATLTSSQLDNNSMDDCGIASYALSQSSFDCSNTGNNQVTLTVTDNSGLSSSCTATVTVEDALKPTAKCKDFTIACPGSQVTITPADVNDGSFDNCSVSLSLDQTVLSCSNSSVTVTLTATDSTGNTDDCTAVVTLQSSGGGGITLSIDDVEKQEGNFWGVTIFKFTVTRSGGTGAVTVDFATQDGTATSTGPLFSRDYTTLNGTLTWSSGGTNTKFVNVAVKKDNNAEPDENFFVNLSNPTGGAVIGDGQGEGTILNDDGAPIIIDPNDGSQSIQSQHFVAEDLELNVYPNPVRTVMNIELSAHPISDSPANSQLKMVDLNGRTIWTHTVQNQENFIQVPTGDWSSGAYILYWINDQNVKTQKVIIE